MASSSENLMSNILIDPLAFMRETNIINNNNINSSWLSDFYSNSDETLTLTRALQKSLEPSPTISSLSGGSDPEINNNNNDSAAPKIQIQIQRGNKVKIAKRKSRATKRSQTTFITADAANFRQMVQQITGVRFPAVGPHFSANNATIVKPEPMRGFAGVVPCPPTLDTSAAILMDQNRTSQSSVAMERRSFEDFDGLQSFPTLESWKVM